MKQLQTITISLISTGCCFEDKLFPKTNSLMDDRAQPLADIEEFALKIKVIILKQRTRRRITLLSIEPLLGRWSSNR